MIQDRELLARIVTHDEEAFELFCERYQASLQRHLLRMMRAPDLTDDLLQETLLRVWQHAAQWDGHGSPRGWLFRVATNLALNALRTQRRRPQAALAPPTDADEETPVWHADPNSGPEELAERADEHAQLRRLVAGLSEEKREVLRMIHNDELSVDEVARALGIPPGTVRSRLHYATRQLARDWPKDTDG